MDHRPMTPSAPRALRLGLVVTLAVSSMFVSTGCHKRRSAMRPVIISPNTTVGVTPSATCDTEPGLTAAPSVELQRPLTDPSFTPSSGGEVERRPVGPETKSGVGRPYSPPVPDTLAEPELTLPDPPKSRRNSGGTGTGSGTGGSGLMPDLSPPDSPKSTSNNARPTSGSRVRQASSLREVVRPYVNDPEDLFAPAQGGSPLEICRHPPQRQRDRQLRSDRPRASQNSRLERLRLSFCDRQRQR